MMKRKIGISLISLIITIIVIIILAGTTVASLLNNNIIGQAKEAAFKTNVDQYNDELLLATSNKYIEERPFDPTTFDMPTWNGQGTGSGTIKEYITSMTKEDGKNFEIRDSKLVYVGESDEERDWFIGTELDSKPFFVENFQTDTYKSVNTTGNWRDGTLGTPTHEVLKRIKNIGTNGYDSFYSVIEDSDGNYVAVGEANDQFFIAKFNKSLGLVSEKTFGSTSYEFLNCVVEDYDGNYVAVGTSEGNLTSYGGTTNKGSCDQVIVKFDKSLNILKLNHIGAAGDDHFLNCIVDSSGNYVVVGYTTQNLTVYGAAAIKGQEDAVIIRFGRDLNLLNAQTIGGVDMDEFNDILQDSNGDYIAIGSSEGLDTAAYGSYGATDANGFMDSIVVRLDSTLQLKKILNFGGPTGNILNCIIKDNTGNFVVTGSTSMDLSAYGGYPLSNEYTGDYFVAKLDSDLGILKMKNFGTKSFGMIGPISIDATGNYYFLTMNFTPDTILDGDVTVDGRGLYGFGKMDSNFNLEFINTFGEDMEHDSLNNLVHSSNGNYIVVGSNIYNKSSIALEAANSCSEAGIYEFGAGTYDSTKNILESNIVAFDSAKDAIRINISSEISTKDNYNFYLSNDGINWRLVPNDRLDGLTNITLGGPVTGIYYKVELIGYDMRRPEIYAIEFYDKDSTKSSPKSYFCEDITYQYETATTKLTGSSHDEDEFNITLDFTLKVGDKSYNQLYVGTNGVVSPIDKHFCYDIYSLYTEEGSQAISAYWADLVVNTSANASSGIYYKLGTENSKRYVLVEYRNVFIYDYEQAGFEGNFEIKIYEDGTVKMYYKDVDFYDETSCNGGDAVIGVSLDGADINQYSYFQNKLSQNKGIMFTIK